jgi:hypothetical protein
VITFKADEKPLQRFMPVNLEVVEVDLNGRTVFEVRLDYKIDLSSAKKMIIGA